MTSPDRRQRRPLPQRSRGPKPERQPPMFLLTGLIAGLVLGLLMAWIVFPARAGSIDPSQLNSEQKDQYRVAIALAYASSGDLGRAEARLALLNDPNPGRALRNQAQLQLLQPGGQREARALDQLADALAGVIAPSATPDAAATPEVTGTPDGGG